MRTTRPRAIRSVTRLKHAAFVAGLSAALLVVAAQAALGIAHARGGPSNTRADAWGTPEVAASAWLTSLGGGVTIYSNGPQVTYTPDKPNNTVNGVVSGEEWQCVELVNRLYLTKGWITSTWKGNGAQLYGNAPSNLKKEPNGSITYLSPGDVIGFGGGYGNFGHVAIVNAVNGSAVQIASQNTNSVFDSSLTLQNGWLASPAWTGNYYSIQGVIHHPLDRSQPAFYANTIVQWDGDTKPQKTAWYVSADLKRYWIPDSSTFYCLEGMGIKFVGPISATLLNQLPDQTGHWARCSNAQPTAPVSVVLTPTPTPGPPAPTPTPTQAPPPPPSSYAETAGPAGSGTFTDYTNAGGTVGQRVAAYQTIQVTCRLTGWTAPDGDNWWYQLPAIAPWNSSVFYAPADNFYNNGQTSGSLKGTPPYDPNVPLC